MAMTVNEEVKSSTPAVAPTLILLELAFFERYNRAGVLYTRKTEDGKPRAYRFTLEQARVLLREVEDGTGRPIWVRAKPKAKVEDPETFDSQDLKPLEAIHPSGHELSARADVGTDDELRELLGDSLDDLDEVQV